MASDKDVEITVKVNADGAISTFDRLGNKIKEVTGATTSSSVATEAATAALGPLGGLATAAATAIGSLVAGFLSYKTLQIGDAFNDASEALGKLAEKAGTTADTIINQTNKALGGSIDQLTLMQSANKALIKGLDPKIFDEVAFAAKKYADATGTDAAEAIDKFTTAITKGREAQLKQLGLLKDGKIVLEGFTQAQLDSIEANKGAADIMDTLGARTHTAFEKFAAAIDNSEALRAALRTLGGAVVWVIERISDFAVWLIKLSDAAMKPIKREVDNLSRGFAVLGELMKQLSGGSALSLSKAIDSAAKSFADANKQIGNTITLDLPKHLQEGSDAAKKMADDLDKVNRAIADLVGFDRFPSLTKAIQDVFVFNKAGGLGAENLAMGLEMVAKAAQESGIPLDEFQNRVKAITDAQKEGGKQAAEWGRDQQRAADDAQKAIDNLISSLEGTAGQGLASVISGLFSGDKGGIKSGLRGAGSSVGSAIGDFFGGPFGAAIGAELGDSIGKGVFDAFNHIFGGRDAQGKMRDSLDRFFADVFKDNPLQAIIEGQLQTITDLDFLRGGDAFTSGSFDDMFQGLGAAAQNAFSGVAAGFTNLLGIGTDISSQLAAVFANNLGGSLNNLQLLVESTGKSFEDLRQGVVEAFLDGKLSALEAQSALNGIAQIATKGIPDGIGLTKQAFDNLKAAGTKGGRALVDALQDIAYEAKELGIKDFPALQAQLVGTGANAEEVKQLFDALGAVGIDSIQELTGATKEQLIPVLASLESIKFPFAEQVKTVDELINRVQQLPKQIESNITLNVRTNFDGNTQQLVNSNAVPQINGAIGAHPGA